MDKDKEDDSLLARGMINLWNTHFSPTLYKRDDGRDAKLNFVKMFNWNPVNYNSNAKMKVADKEPNANIFINSKDGIKIGTSIWLNDKPTNKWVIGIHGYNSSRYDVLYLTWHYRDLGYNILTFDFRNHGASDNEAVTWGYKEKWDLIAVIEWLLKAYKVEEMGLVGTSMGAFTLNYLFLTEPELIKRAKIRWGVSDSGYMAVPKLLEGMVANNAPKFLGKMTRNTLRVMMNIYKKEYGVDFAKLDFISLIKPGDWHPPVLYVHNRGDRITNYLDSFRMATIKNNLENTKANELYIMDGKHHTKALIEFPDKYRQVTLDFVKKHQLPREETVTIVEEAKS